MKTFDAVIQRLGEIGHYNLATFIVGEFDRLRGERNEAREKNRIAEATIYANKDMHEVAYEIVNTEAPALRSRVKALEGLLREVQPHLDLNCCTRCEGIDEEITAALSTPAPAESEPSCDFCGCTITGPNNAGHHSAECVDRTPCSNCGGSGWLDDELKNGSPVKTRCPDCSPDSSKPRSDPDEPWEPCAFCGEDCPDCACEPTTEESGEGGEE